VVGLVGLVLEVLLKQQIPAWLGNAGFTSDTVTWLTAYKGWRLMMMLGTTPALLTFLIRLFVPESHKWEEEHKTGSTSNWVTADLLGVLLGALGPALIIAVWAYEFVGLAGRIGLTLAGLVIAVVGYTYPVVRYLQRSLIASGSLDKSSAQTTIKLMLLGACLSGVALLGTWGSTQWAARWAGELTGNELQSREWTQIWLAVGAITGTLLAAMMGDWFGRRMSYFMLCILALGSAEFLYAMNASYGTMFLFSSFLAGCFTASFYGWLPLYLPELFATRVRATGQGFSFNFGRIIAAVGTLQTGVLVDKVFDGSLPKAGMLMSLIYVVGMAIIWFAPETRGKPLPE